MKTNTKNVAWITLLGIIAIVIIVIIVILINFRLTYYPFGPTQTLTVKVTRLYVDMGGNSKDGIKSHYMVGTDQGVFEVNNSFFAGVYDADRLYAALEAGKSYRITVKGEAIVGWFYQEYPGIIKVEGPL